VNRQIVSVADEIAKFAALRDQGVITEGEFALKKAQLLALDPQPVGESAPPPAPPSGLEVVIQDAGRNAIMVIKIVREATGLGLKEAKDLVDAVPASLRTTDPAAARMLQSKLERAGARVEIR
jgi:large subunit ribosomal protein L7/L12